MPIDRLRSIVTLALPIVGGMLSQNLLNAVDTAMVGRLGAPQLGAVGLGGFATFMIVALVIGIASGGVQPTAARRVGQGRIEESALALNGGLLLAVVIGVPITAIAYTMVPYAFPILNSDPEVVAAGVPYVRVRLLAMVVVAANFSFRGYWNGVSRPGFYLRTLLLIHAVNIFLDWVLIFGKLGAPALGTFGAGLASTIATCCGTAYYFAQALRHATPNGFLHAMPTRRTLTSMMRLGVPVALQQFSFFLGFTMLFLIVGRVGTAELGVATVLVNVSLLAILPGLGLGLAAATLAGQALGRGEQDDAEQWGWEVMRVGIAYALLIATVFITLTDTILSVFLTDPETIALARAPLRLVGLTLIFDVSGIVLSNALQGVGDMRRVLFASLAMQWGVMLPLAYFVGPVRGHGILAIWAAVGFWRAGQAVVYGALWRGRGWASIRV